jgi:uncharacterized membrane protein (DUF2068 family)
LNVQPQKQVENEDVEVLGRAPTLYVIIGIKLLKGLILLLLGIGIYSLSDNNLPDEFAGMLQFFHLDPSTKFFADLSVKLGNLTESKLIWVGWTTVVYSTFSLVEGTGLILRVSWAGWLAMAESVFFIPIELYDLVQKFTVSIFIILVLNVAIVWYLFRNRHRLFHHHHHHHRRAQTSGGKRQPAPHSSAT